MALAIRHADIKHILQLRTQGSTKGLLGYQKIVAAFVLQLLKDLIHREIS